QLSISVSKSRRLAVRRLLSKRQNRHANAEGFSKSRRSRPRAAPHAPRRLSSARAELSTAPFQDRLRTMTFPRLREAAGRSAKEGRKTASLGSRGLRSPATRREFRHRLEHADAFRGRQLTLPA